MLDLWHSNDLDQWKAHATKIQKCLELKTGLKKKKNKRDLISLDNELKEIKKKLKTEPFLTTEELAKCVEWKMTRNVFRPTAVAMARRNDTTLTEKISKEAFEMIPNNEEKPDLEIVKKCVKKMSELRGIGPATSSLLLSLKSEWFPFGADEALNATGVVKPKYSLKEYLNFVEAVWDKYEDLGSPTPDITPAVMSDCLWVQKIWRKHGDSEIGNTTRQKGKKRKGQNVKKTAKRRKIGS